jgi:hypothetical protein
MLSGFVADLVVGARPGEEGGGCLELGLVPADGPHPLAAERPGDGAQPLEGELDAVLVDFLAVPGEQLPGGRLPVLAEEEVDGELEEELAERSGRGRGRDELQELVEERVDVLARRGAP